MSAKNPTEGLWSRRNTPSLPTTARLPRLSRWRMWLLDREDARMDERGE